MSGWMNPAGAPTFWLQSAMRPAHSGATALVPPMTPSSPSTRTRYPVCGSATPATSGTPRPRCLPGLADAGTPAARWYDGNGKTSLTPPPVALLCGSSFHTFSDAIFPPWVVSRVPPQHNTCGLDPGKSACARPSGSAPPSGFSSPEPASPAAQHTVTHSAAAAWNSPSKLAIAWRVQSFSALPQLIEITDGLFSASWIA